MPVVYSASSSTHSITNEDVFTLASNRLYAWMTSLRPLRDALQMNKSRSCCSGRAKLTAGTVTPDIYIKVSRHPLFQTEMRRLKKELSAQRLIVAVGDVRTTI